MADVAWRMPNLFRWSRGYQTKQLVNVDESLLDMLLNLPPQ